MNSIQYEINHSGSGAALSEVYLLFQSQDLKHKVLVLVEGPDDKFVYGNVLSSDNVYLLPKNIRFHENLVTEVNKKYPKQIISIMDSDFHNANQDQPLCSALFYTDAHDLETMILQHCNINDLVGEEYQRLCDGVDISHLSEILKDYSYIKWYNYNEHRNLSFKKINTVSLYKSGLLEKRNELFLAIIEASPNNTANIKELDAFQETHSMVSLFSIINGHDLMDCIYYEMHKKHKGNLQKKKLTRTILRGYSAQMFQNTILYANLLSWCKKNSNILPSVNQ